MSDTSVADDAHRDDYRLLMSCFPSGVAGAASGTPRPLPALTTGKTLTERSRGRRPPALSCTGC